MVKRLTTERTSTLLVILLVLAILLTPMITEPQHVLGQDASLSYYSLANDGHLLAQHVIYEQSRESLTADYSDISNVTLNVGQSAPSAISLTGALAYDHGVWQDETGAANDVTPDDMHLVPDARFTAIRGYAAHGSTWHDLTESLQDSATSVLLPPLNVGTEGDTTYLGLLDTFTEVTINVTVAGSYTNITHVWEYYNGVHWSVIITVAETSPGLVDFTNVTKGTISFDEPPDWATTTVDSITDLYWIRVRTFFSGENSQIHTVPEASHVYYLPSVDYAYYFGWAESMPVVLELDVGVGGVGDWIIAWEYRAGSVWIPLPNLVDGTDSFRTVGSHEVSWDLPSNVLVYELEGISAYWIRARWLEVEDYSRQALGTQAWFQDYYSIWRGGINFNTSTLPDTASILSATLFLHVENVYAASNFNVRVVSGSGMSDPMSGTDFSYLLSRTSSLGELSTLGIVADDTVTIELNAVGHSHINLVGITSLALRSVNDITGIAPLDDEYIAFSSRESETNSPVLFVEYTALGGGTVTASSFGTFDGHITAEDADYNVARDATIGSVQDTDIAARIGQQYDGAQYSIWRSAVHFDLRDIPSNAQVTAAVVRVYGHSSNAYDSFHINLVSGDAIELPMSSYDYPVFGNTALGALHSDSWFAGQYLDLTLSVAGREHIKCGGITSIGLRSSKEMEGVVPTGEEFVTFYTADSLNKPQLHLTYTVPDLSHPNMLSIVTARVFSGYLVEGDSLIALDYKCHYADGNPGVNPSDYFYVQLYDRNDNLRGQTSLNNWGHAVASIYMSEEISADGGYYIVLTGSTQKFAEPLQHVYTLHVDDFMSGAVHSIATWVRWRAIAMSPYYDTTLVAWVDGAIKLNELGQAIFDAGIPGLSALHPNLFVISVIPPTPESDEAYEEYVTEVGLGDYVTSRLEMVGNVFGISGNMVGGFALLGIVAACVGTLYRYTGNITGGAIVSIPILIVFSIMDIVPLALIAILGTICAALLFHTLWLSRT